MFWIFDADTSVAPEGALRLNIRFAAADACAISIATLVTTKLGKDSYRGIY